MTNTYNTGNPIGSTDPRDAADNKSNFDEFANSTESVYTDRFGVSRLTQSGALSRYAAFSNRGEWAASTSYNVNDIWQNGSGGAFYLVPADYTSGATASEDIANGSVVLYQDPDSTDRVIPVNNVTQLRTLVNLTDGQVIYLKGHTQIGVGGGELIVIGDQTTETDNNGTLFVVGGKLIRRSLYGFVTPKMFGAVMDGANNNPTDNTIAINNLLSAAGTEDEVIFDGMYAVSGITLTRNNNSGITIKGNKNPPDLGVDNNTPGLSAFGAQSMVLTIGETAGTFEGGSLENFCIYGRDQELSLAAFVPERWSQGNMRNVLVTRSKGRLILPRKWEDMDIYNLRCLFGGTPSGQEGGLMFGESPDLSTNVLKFFGGRFEWIDGPHIGLATDIDDDSSVSHAIFIGTKFEAGERDGYGTTRNSNSVWDLRPNAQFRCQNIRFIDCWLAQANQSSQVLHLGSSHGVRVENLKMSTPISDGVTTVLMNETGGTDARDFVWKNNSIINTSGDYSSFTIGSSINCINPVEYERPTEYQTNGSRLSNNNPNALDANIIGVSGRMLSNPSNTSDPSITSSETVCSTSGSNTNTLCFLSSTRYDPDNTQSGFSPDLYNGIFEVRVRAKKTGDASNANIEMRSQGSFVSQISVTSESFLWYSMYGNFRDFSGTLTLTNSSSNQSDHVIYVDAVEILPTKEFYANSIPTSGSYVAGERVRFNSPSSGSPAGAVCVLSGSPGTWANEPNLS